MSEDRCRVGVVALIRDEDGNLLMERRAVDEEAEQTWSFIAGGKKAGEDVVEAAKREVREEVAAEFVPEEIVGIVDHESQRDDDTSWTVVGFRGTLADEPTNNEPDKREEIAWQSTIPDDLHPTSELILSVADSETLHPRL